MTRHQTSNNRAALRTAAVPARKTLGGGGAAFLAALLLLSCSNPSGPKRNEAKIQGVVYRNDTRTPVPGATIVLERPVSVATAGEGGSYSMAFTADTTYITNVIATMPGFRSDTEQVVVVPQKTSTVDLYLRADTSSPVTPSQSGDAANIYLVDFTPEFISVSGTGANDVAKLTFQVRDAHGTPVDSAHGVTVAFSITNGPSRGEYIFPSSAPTDPRTGKVTVSLNAGTKSGVVQILATAQVGTKMIGSEPVRMTIFGGLPDQAHFSIAPQMYNFPGLDWLNRTDQIMVLVGDKYSNPVQPRTAVYFETAGGVVDASGYTDAAGLAGVTLRSGNPIGNDPVYGPGFAYLKARTVGENGATVKDSILILFSGFPTEMTLSPSSFNLPVGDQAGEVFTYRIADRFGHPMAEGAAVNVTSDGAPVVLSGDVNLEFPDTQSSSWTTFHFKVNRKESDPGAKSGNVAINIKVTGQNGNRSISLTGYVAY